jgi:hypothetical protein
LLFSCTKNSVVSVLHISKRNWTQQDLNHDVFSVDLYDRITGDSKERNTSLPPVDWMCQTSLDSCQCFWDLIPGMLLETMEGERCFWGIGVPITGVPERIVFPWQIEIPITLRLTIRLTIFELNDEVNDL